MSIQKDVLKNEQKKFFAKNSRKNFYELVKRGEKFLY